MAASQLRLIPLLAAAVLLGACGERVDIEVKSRLDGQPAAQAKVMVDREELGVTDAQGVLTKQITRKAGTELDAVIRNLGVTTIVLMGVSLNLGIIGAALSALDHGYQVVVVRDAVTGLPREYAEAVLENSIAMIATVVTADELIAAWS